MANREEIREGLYKIIYPNVGAACAEFGGEADAETKEEVNEILNYLHSQGVVIKVDDKDDPFYEIGIYPKAVEGGEHPYTKRSDYQNGWNDGVMKLTKLLGNHTATEPLIKELP